MMDTVNDGKSIITAAQIRAGRALLGWSQTELAAKSGVGRATIERTESGRAQPQLRSIAAIRDALIEGGVEFIPENGGGAGARLRSR